MQESEEKDPVVNQCPDCSQSLDVSAFAPFSKIECPHCGGSVRVRTMMGKYHITGILGAGGMSQVFRAVDMHLGREVALKILHQSLSRDSALTAMFEREAKLTASILHPNVVKVYTVGNDQGYFFIAMELVDATSLEDLIAHKGALSESDVLRTAHDVTSGLRAAYEESLIHRDIKPGNMLVTADGTSKLVDFGLAVHQGGEDESEELWATPFYVPPEKLEGESDTYLGDIYSLGATLYHALAGKPPFEANTSSMEELKVIKKNQVDLKSVAPGVTKPTIKLIERMMAYKAADRPQDYDEILVQIEEIEKRQFGVKRDSRGEISSKKTTSFAIGIVSALTAVAVFTYFFVTKDQSVGNPGDIGIGSGERVISAGDNSNTEKFLEGRELVSKGEFEKAEPIFDALAVETSPSPSTRMWTLYFQGLIRLYLGDEVKARKSFSLIGAINNTGDEQDTEKVMPVLERAAPILGNPLPVQNAENKFQKDSIEAVSILAAGLKNWQQGQFEAGLRVLEVFAESSPPEGLDWLIPLKETIDPFRRDFEKISTAPNPSREDLEKLDGQKKLLEAMLLRLETKGAAPRIVEERIERVEDIRKLVAEAKARRDRPVPVRPVVTEAKPPAMKGTKSKSSNNELTADEIAERDRMIALLETLQSYGETLLFSGAVAKLQAEAFETERGQLWQEDLIAGYQQADRFVGLLASKLQDGSYKGRIRRREGVPLDATITAADNSVFQVDLGFGPNQVDVGSFAPDWLVEAAGTELSELSSETAEDWKSVLFFSLATGQSAEAERIAKGVAAIDPKFTARWKRLSQLRSPGS